MALLRVLHATNLPDPGKLAKRLEEIAASGGGAQATQTGESEGATSRALDWAELVDRVDAAGQLQAASIMRLQVRPIAVEKGRLVYSRADRYSDRIEPILRDALRLVTGENWQVEAGDPAAASPSLVEIQQAEREQAKAALREHPLVKATFAAFPDAELIEDGAETPPRRRGIPWSKNA